MRPSRRHPLPAAHDRPPPPRVHRGIAAAPDRCRRDPRREGAAAMKSPLADTERDRLVVAMLPDVPVDGWSRHGLRRAAERFGIPVAEARALFPRARVVLEGPFSRWAARQMLDRLEAATM